jgi:hypothetical protein
MAQYTPIDPNTLLPGAPWTSAKAQAAFENLDAMAEGADGAPKLVAKAMAGNMRLPAFSGGGSTWAGLTGLGDFSEILFTGGITSSSTSLDTAVLSIRFSIDNGANWVSEQVLFAGPASTVDYSGALTVHLNIVTGACAAIIAGGDADQAQVNVTLSLPAGVVNGVQFRARGVATSRVGLVGTATGGKA